MRMKGIKNPIGSNLGACNNSAMHQCISVELQLFNISLECKGLTFLQYVFKIVRNNSCLSLKTINWEHPLQEREPIFDPSSLADFAQLAF